MLIRLRELEGTVSDLRMKVELHFLGDRGYARVMTCMNPERKVTNLKRGPRATNQAS